LTRQDFAMRLLALFLLLAALPATAQTIYKCKGASGRIEYQQMPCANEAATIESREVKAPGPASASTGGLDARTSMTRQVEATRLEESVQRCISAASANAYRAPERRIKQLEADKARIQADIRRANNNLAGASWEAGLRSQIGSIEAAIATERSSADNIFNQARQRCLDDGERRRQEMADQHAAEDAARAEQQQRSALPDEQPPQR
jgi:hypothetical protein